MAVLQPLTANITLLFLYTRLHWSKREKLRSDVMGFEPLIRTNFPSPPCLWIWIQRRTRCRTIGPNGGLSLSTVHPLQKVSCWLPRTFHGWHQRLAPHYEEKAEIEHTALLQVGWLQGWFWSSKMENVLSLVGGYKGGMPVSSKFTLTTALTEWFNFCAAWSLTWCAFYVCSSLSDSAN